MAYTRGKYLRIISAIYLALPFTLLKQRLFFRLRKPPEGLPQFLCIGAQKAGTTWLNEQFKKHPELCMPDPKEVRFFDWYFYRSFRWYLSHFHCAEGKIKGEVTPGYSIIEKGRVRFIRRVMPGVKIILLLRDPRKRAWSSARYHFAKEMGRDLTKVSMEEFIVHFERSWVRKMGDYKTIWKKWSSVFPREQLLVVFNEEIELYPQQVMERICNFIGVSPLNDLAALGSRPNKSQEMKMPEEIKKYLDEKYLPVIREMKVWLGEENKFWLE
jgi:hypothetical protein